MENKKKKIEIKPTLSASSGGGDRSGALHPRMTLALNICQVGELFVQRIIQVQIFTLDRNFQGELD